MFARLDSRRSRAERIAGQAWDHLAAAVEQAGSSTRHRAAGVYHDASHHIDAGRREAARRAGAAYAALSGRRPRNHWQWFAAGALVGVAAGWTARTMTHRITARDEVAMLDSLEEEFTQIRP